MKYIKVISLNDPKTILTFFIELDDNFMETRKIELADGNLIGFAGIDVEFHGTVLAKEPLLTIPEINALSNRQAHEIDKEEFENLWEKVIAFI